MDKAQTLDKYCARLLMIGFFLPMKLQAAAIVLPCFYFLCKVLIGKYPILWSSVKWVFVLSSGFLLYLFAIPLTDSADMHFLMSFISNRVSILLIPLLFTFIMPLFGQMFINELRFFVYACLAVCIIANLAFIYDFFFLPHLPGEYMSHVMYRQFLEHTTGLHPTYLSMYIMFAICVLLTGYFPANRIAKFGILYLLLIFLLAILSKSPLIALLLIFLHYGYTHRQILKRYRALLAGLSTALVIGCFFIPFIGQRVGEMTSYFGSAKPEVAVNNSIYIRKLIWETDTHLIKQYWITGIGPARMLRFLDYRYFFYSISHNFAVGYYDPHSEYYWQWLSFGIIGIVVCLFTLGIHFVRATKNKNHLYFYLLIILSTTFFTESVLSRQQGVLFYTVFTSLLFFCKPPTPAS